MTKRYLLLFFISLLIISGTSAQNSRHITVTREIALAEQKKAAGAGDSLVHRAGLNIDVFYTRFNWSVDPAVQFISGEVTSCFTAVHGDVSQILLELDSTMTVDSVVFRQHAVPAEFVSGYELQITLDAVVPENHQDSLSIFYHGIPREGNGFGSFVTSEHEGTPVLWTLSEPYGAKDWWPGKNDLTDKIDSIDIFVSVPAGNRVGSNGLLVSETQAEAGRALYHWRHRYPIACYLVAIAVTNYVQFTNYALVSGDSVPILNYVYPEDSAQAAFETKNTADIIHLYDSLFGPYPFAAEKYGHAQFSLGGGMEHQTMSFMTGFGHDLRAHELAHSWFGNKITLASWHDIFLNEGFATYANGLSFENMYDGYYWNIWKSNTLGAVTSQPDGSVYVADTTDVSRIFNERLSYHKGAYLLHMLRWILGDEAFFTAVRSYVADPELAYRFATFDDLKSHLEQAGNTDLTWFFDEWYYGQGYPSYDINVSQSDSDRTVKVIIQQEQSHPSVAFFELPVPVWIFGDGMSKQLICDNTFSGEMFTFPDPGFAIDSVKFDPDRWLCAHLDNISLGIGTQARLFRDLDIHPNPAGNTIRFDIPDMTVQHLEVYDIIGRQVKILNFDLNRQTVRADVRHLDPGVYLLRVQTGKGVCSGKFVKK